MNRRDGSCRRDDQEEQREVARLKPVKASLPLLRSRCPAPWSSQQAAPRTQSEKWGPRTRIRTRGCRGLPPHRQPNPGPRRAREGGGGPGSRALQSAAAGASSGTVVEAEGLRPIPLCAASATSESLASPARGAERVRQASGGRGCSQGRAAPGSERRSSGRSRRPSEGVVRCLGASPPAPHRSFQEVPGRRRGNLAEPTRTLSAAPRRWRTRRLSVRRRGVIGSARVVRRGRRRRPPPSPPNVKMSVGCANSTCALPSKTREVPP